MIKIETVANGYVIEFQQGYSFKEVYSSTDELFTRLLSYLEHRSPHFKDDAFGVVTINRGEKGNPC